MMKKVISGLLVWMLICGVCACAEEMYNYIDPSIVIGADEIPWVTITAKNDQPMDNGQHIADKVFLDGTGTKIPMPEDPNEWAAWLDDICMNKTEGKGDLAFCKYANEDFLRILYEVDDTLYSIYQRHVYSDYTRIMISGLKGYVYWSTGSDGIQHGAKVVYDEETGIFTVSEFNLLTMDGSFTDVMAAAYFGYLRYTCNYRVETQSGNLLLREEPSSDGKVLAKIGKGKEIDAIFDYTYTADNGYDYVPVRYKEKENLIYGWVALDYLGMNDRVDAITWVGRRPMELEYPSAVEFMQAEGKEAISLEVTIENEPANGEAFKEDEQVLFVINAVNNTFATIDRAELVDVDDVIISIPWRQASVIEVGHVVTADEASAGSFEQVFSMIWTDNAGEQSVTSDALTISTCIE